MQRLVYLASPYAHKLKHVMMGRYYQTAVVTAQIIEHGIPVLSPIVHCHHLREFGLLTVSEDTMRAYDLAYIDACAELWILHIPGWEESVGIKKEMDHAVACGKLSRGVFVDNDSIITNWHALEAGYEG